MKLKFQLQLVARFKQIKFVRINHFKTLKCLPDSDDYLGPSYTLYFVNKIYFFNKVKKKQLDTFVKCPQNPKTKRFFYFFQKNKINKYCFYFWCALSLTLLAMPVWQKVFLSFLYRSSQFVVVVLVLTALGSLAVEKWRNWIPYAGAGNKKLFIFFKLLLLFLGLGWLWLGFPETANFNSERISPFQHQPNVTLVLKFTTSDSGGILFNLLKASERGHKKNNYGCHNRFSSGASNQTDWLTNAEFRDSKPFSSSLGGPPKAAFGASKAVRNIGCGSVKLTENPLRDSTPLVVWPRSLGCRSLGVQSPRSFEPYHCSGSTRGRLPWLAFFAKPPLRVSTALVVQQPALGCYSVGNQVKFEPFRHSNQLNSSTHRLAIQDSRIKVVSQQINNSQLILEVPAILRKHQGLDFRFKIDKKKSLRRRQLTLTRRPIATDALPLYDRFPSSAVIKLEKKWNCLHKEIRKMMDLHHMLKAGNQLLLSSSDIKKEVDSRQIAVPKEIRIPLLTDKIGRGRKVIQILKTLKKLEANIREKENSKVPLSKELLSALDSEEIQLIIRNKRIKKKKLFLLDDSILVNLWVERSIVESSSYLNEILHVSSSINATRDLIIQVDDGVSRLRAANPRRFQMLGSDTLIGEMFLLGKYLNSAIFFHEVVQRQLNVLGQTLTQLEIALGEYLGERVLEQHPAPSGEALIQTVRQSLAVYLPIQACFIWKELNPAIFGLLSQPAQEVDQDPANHTNEMAVLSGGVTIVGQVEPVAHVQDINTIMEFNMSTTANLKLAVDNYWDNMVQADRFANRLLEASFLDQLPPPMVEIIAASVEQTRLALNLILVHSKLLSNAHKLAVRLTKVASGENPVFVSPQIDLARLALRGELHRMAKACQRYSSGPLLMAKYMLEKWPADRDAVWVASNMRHTSPRQEESFWILVQNTLLNIGDAAHPPDVRDDD